LETILKQLEVATTTVAALLVLDLILHNKGLVGEVDGLGKGSRDGVVGGLTLGDETFVAINEDGVAVLYLPFADVAEGLSPYGSLLGGFGGCPSLRPVVGKLLEERCLDGGGLRAMRKAWSILYACDATRNKPTLKTGLVSSALDALAAATARRAESATLRIVYEGP
jgi:hypothetical protein